MSCKPTWIFTRIPRAITAFLHARATLDRGGVKAKVVGSGASGAGAALLLGTSYSDLLGFFLPAMNERRAIDGSATETMLETWKVPYKAGARVRARAGSFGSMVDAEGILMGNWSPAGPGREPAALVRRALRLIWTTRSDKDARRSLYPKREPFSIHRWMGGHGYHLEVKMGRIVLRYGQVADHRVTEHGDYHFPPLSTQRAASYAKKQP
ncbi:hypothetical protein DFP72DRAFT_1046653 [Ephemerocybe angulata]|uniref:Uncharacterized protein n=1 Tax=Ephemerocybe angulata TaxID=980116 RepID=A0A8H6HVE7_9AGAR|nr:hypothetical protein DFP72DRAFT_1046653 [Tulosesus angulatus]